MSKRTRTVLIVIAVAVAAYLVYRWWSNRQSSGTTDTTGLGSNLNSLAPELVAGSAGPSSGLTYTPGNTQVDLTLPGGGPSQDITGSDITDSEDNDVDKPPVVHRDCPAGMHKDPNTGKCVKNAPKKPPRRPPPRRPPPHWIPPPQGAQHGGPVR